jgi:hypothetical protein
MSRGRPRHQSSRRRMYSPRQRDVRERRIHQRIDEQWAAIEIVTTDTDDATEIEPQASWAMPLSARPSAA